MELIDTMNITPSESEAWDIVQMEEIEREWGTIHVGVWCVFLMWDVVKMVEEIDVVHVIYLATEVEFV